MMKSFSLSATSSNKGCFFFPLAYSAAVMATELISRPILSLARRRPEPDARSEGGSFRTRAGAPRFEQHEDELWRNDDRCEASKTLIEQALPAVAGHTDATEKSILQ